MNKIENRRQELITKRWIYNFKDAKAQFLKECDKAKEPAKWKLGVNSFDGMIDDLEQQLRVYYRSPAYFKYRIKKWIRNKLDPNGTCWDAETVSRVTAQHDITLKSIRSKWRRDSDNVQLLKRENIQLHQLCDKLIADGRLTIDEMRSAVNSRKEAKILLFGNKDGNKEKK